MPASREDDFVKQQMRAVQMANRNLSKRSDKMNVKINKNNVSSNIYGSSLQNTKDYTQNIKMINEKIRNESISFSKTSVN